MSEIEISGTIQVGTSEEAAYAEVLEKIDELQDTIDGLSDNAITTNGEFDDTAGFWGQVQNGHTGDLGDKRADSIIVHKRELSENFKNLDVSPAIVTQTKVSYNPSSTTGENFTRMSSSYHELIVDGKAIVPNDGTSPNFTALGATAYNKAWGGIGATAVTGRVEDLYYSSAPTGYESAGANKTCGGFFAARRNSPYSQGHQGTSYSIALEAQMINAPNNLNTYALITGTDEYPGNPDNKIGKWDSWTNAFHEIVGGRRPVSAGIMINGFSQKYYEGTNNEVTLRNGAYNAIVIGATSMQIRGGVPTGETDENDNPILTDGNSHETVAINTANWTQAKHGFYLLKHGYSGRVLKTNSSSLFETDGAKFLNATGNMPFAISANGTPYLDFKTGTDTDYFIDGSAHIVPKERPTDTTRARVGYVPTANLLNISSDGAVKFLTSRDFSDSTVETLDFIMSGNGFYPSSMVNLGSQNYFWENIYARKGAINIADTEKYRDTTAIETTLSTPAEITNLLTAWGNIKYKVFKFLDTNSQKHIGLSAQDIADAFTSQGLSASNYGLYFSTTNNDVTTYGVRYNECLAMECAYLRNELKSIKSRLTALEGA